MTRIVAEKMARNSWQVPLIILLLMAITTSMVDSPLATIIISIIYLVLFITGLVCAVISLLAIRDHGSSKLLAPALIGIILNVSIPGIIIAIAVPSYLEKRSAAAEGKLSQIAKEISRTAPMMIDKETRLDAVEVSSSDSLDFKYTLITANKDQVNVPAFTNTMTTSLYDWYMNAPYSKWLRTHGIKTNHIYNDKEGKRITVIAIMKNIQH